jgi:hypothetical protein
MTTTQEKQVVDLLKAIEMGAPSRSASSTRSAIPSTTSVPQTVSPAMVPSSLRWRQDRRTLGYHRGDPGPGRQEEPERQVRLASSTSGPSPEPRRPLPVRTCSRVPSPRCPLTGLKRKSPAERTLLTQADIKIAPTRKSQGAGLLRFARVRAIGGQNL